jgi:hypothetical protein
LLRQSRLPTGFSPALLSPKDLPGTQPGASLYLAGYGLNEEGRLPGQLLYLEGPGYYLHGGGLVIEFTNDQGVCSGDSGSPVFHKRENGLELTAIVSSVSAVDDVSQFSGSECGPLVLTTLLTRERQDWIQEEAALFRKSR